MLAEFIMLLEKYTVGGAISDNYLVQKETIFKKEKEMGICFILFLFCSFF